MYNILLTGATGCLGQRLLARLVQDGHNVLCPIFSDSHRMADSLVGYQTVDTKIADYEKAITNFNPEIVINVAGVYDRGGYTVAQLTEGNLLFPLHLLNVILGNTESRLKLFINTCTSIPKHFNAYAESKWQFAYWGRIYSERYGFSFSNVKLEHFYGPFDNNIKFIQDVIEKLFANVPINLTPGLQERDFIHVSDVVDGFMQILSSELCGYNDIPLGSGKCVPIRRLVEFMKEVSGSTSPLNFGAVNLRENEPMKLVANLEIMRTLGFAPKYDWQSGIRSVINEMREIQ